MTVSFSQKRFCASSPFKITRLVSISGDPVEFERRGSSRCRNDQVAAATVLNQGFPNEVTADEKVHTFQTPAPLMIPFA